MFPRFLLNARQNDVWGRVEGDFVTKILEDGMNK